MSEANDLPARVLQARGGRLVAQMHVVMFVVGPVDEDRRLLAAVEKVRAHRERFQ